ncbi:hypothetical protein [Bdellovibrio bacteriovorus]|uniref:hypothetical protein n=1 Tax=Bdellovibrio bacteriovorus TaxID=959 RepID=UPI0035A64071
MNKISSSKKNASVKTVINILSVLSLVAPSVSLANENDDRRYGKSDKELQAEKERSDRAECTKAQSEIREARSKISEACRKAGLGSETGCTEKAMACSDTLGTESFDTTDAIGTLMGLPAGADIGGSCPQMNGRDYYDEKKRLETEIKDTQKDIAELADDEAEIKETFNTTIQELQQALTDAQQELEETKTSLDEQEREKISEFQASQNAAKEKLREYNSKIIALRSEMTNAVREKATKMLELTAETSKYACNQEYTKAAESYGKVNATSNKSHISKAKAQKAAALDAFNKCMNRFQQARISLNEQSAAKMESINDQIRNAEASTDELNDSLNLASTQLDQMKADTTKRKTQAEKKVTDLMTLTQNKMQAAQENMQTKLKALATKQQSYTEALNRANNSLMTLGPAPKRSAEYTAADASAEIDAQTNNIKEIKSNMENSGITCYLSDASSKSSKRSRSSGSKSGRK